MSDYDRVDAGRDVVDDQGLVTASRHGSDEVWADEPWPTRDESRHDDRGRGEAMRPSLTPCRR